MSDQLSLQDIHRLSTQKVEELFTNGQLSHLKNIQLTAHQIEELSERVLISMIESGFLYSKDLILSQ